MLPRLCRATTFAAVALCLSGLAAEGQAKRPRAKFEPPMGKTLVAVGGSRDVEIEAYRQATGHTPQGAKIYCGLRGEGDVAQIGGGRKYYGCDVSKECANIAKRRVAEASG